MINDFDDERTMEEEEKLAAMDQSHDDELSDLQKEAELPIEKLLEIYNCSATLPQPTALQGSYVDDDENEGDTGQRRRPRRKRRPVKVDLPNIDLPNDDPEPDTSPNKKANSSLSDNEKEDEQEPLSELRKLYPETYQHSIQTTESTDPRQPSENEEDSPDEDEYKKVGIVELILQSPKQ
jgi:hypothetical protein